MSKLHRLWCRKLLAISACRCSPAGAFSMFTLGITEGGVIAFAPQNGGAMSDCKAGRRALPSISLGFVHGLAQMSSIGHVHPIGRPMRAKSAADTLRDDW